MPTLPTDEFLASRAPLRPVPGCEGLRAHQADDVFALWETWEGETGGEQDIPFWAVVWPGAIALARALREGLIPAAGRSVLDVGCGGAVAALAACRAGARRVVANDIDLAALEVARRNAEANGVQVEVDGRNLLALPEPLGFDLVLVGDMFYHRRHAEALEAFARRQRAGGAEVFVADPGRAYAPRDGVELIREEPLPAHRAAEGSDARRVRLLRFR